MIPALEGTEKNLRETRDGYRTEDDKMVSSGNKVMKKMGKAHDKFVKKMDKSLGKWKKKAMKKTAKVKKKALKYIKKAAGKKLDKLKTKAFEYADEILDSVLDTKAYVKLHAGKEARLMDDRFNGVKLRSCN